MNENSVASLKAAPHPPRPPLKLFSATSAFTVEGPDHISVVIYDYETQLPIQCGELRRTVEELEGRMECHFRLIVGAGPLELGANDGEWYINREISTKSVIVLERKYHKMTFVLNGEAIIISHQGEVLDGQHRLTAGLNMPIGYTWFSMLTVGVLPASAHTMDQGKGRGSKDVLHMHRQKHSRIIAKAAPYLKGFDEGKAAKAINLDSDDLLALVAAHPDLPEAAAWAVNWNYELDLLMNGKEKKKPDQPLPVWLAALLFYLGAKIDREKTECFLTRAKTGTEVGSVDDPVWAYRANWAEWNQRVKGKRMAELVLWGWRGLQAVLKGEPLTKKQMAIPETKAAKAKATGKKTRAAGHQPKPKERPDSGESTPAN